MTLKDSARRLLREPLVHFLIGGALIFTLLSGRTPDLGERRIVVDERVVAGLVSRFYDNFRRMPSKDETDGLIRDWVADQVYYREALNLGLDQGGGIERLLRVALVDDTAELRDLLLSQVEEAEAGEVVLLAPAAASFDQYPNFEKRGEDFTALVRALPAV